MGYSSSTATVHKLKHQLEGLYTGQEVHWHVKTGPASRWAYKIREALHIAKRNPGVFPQLAAAADRYTVILLSGNRVAAVPIEISEPAQVSLPEESFSASAVAVAVGRGGAYAEPEAPLTLKFVPGLSGASSVEEIIEHWLSVQPCEKPIVYSDVSLTNRELSTLALWASKLQPEWMVLNSRGHAQITLAPLDPLVPEDARVMP